MKFEQHCDLLIGNRPENDSDEQYYECEDCYRYEICKRWHESQEENDRMSMISEQVNKLRYSADIFNTVGSAWELNHAEAKKLQTMLREAADTIESLSAKLQAANMERSSDCGEVGNGKSFLLIDTPKSCVKCPLKSQMYDNQYICQGNHRRMVIPSNKNKPDWCPLKEIHQSQELEEYNG